MTRWWQPFRPAQLIAEVASVLRQSARERNIELITADVEVGRVYEGRVARLMDFGAFVTILPGRDGLEILRALRDRGLKTPVLVLTARDALQDRVTGLDAGADDYLIKPFEHTEFLARVRALLRHRCELRRGGVAGGVRRSRRDGRGRWC